VAGSEGGDETVVATARGKVVERLVAWREPDQMRNVGRVIDVLNELGVRPADVEDPPRAVLRVDAGGLGQGLDSRLKERGYSVESFNAAWRCDDEDRRARFQNQRAEAFDALRTLLVNGEVALPYNELLEEELRTCSGLTNSMGKLQIISKKEWRDLLQPRRSPDRLDAVVMAVAAPTGLTLADHFAPAWAAL
jgi:hypothetical protein